MKEFGKNISKITFSILFFYVSLLGKTFGYELSKVEINRKSIDEEFNNPNYLSIKKSKISSLEWEKIINKNINKKIEWIKLEKKYKNNLNQESKHKDKEDNLDNINFIYDNLNFNDYVRLGPSFNTGKVIPAFSNFYEVIWKSAFTGGEAGGTGNQNYGFIYDFSLKDKEQISIIYSVSDDPLFSKIKNSDEPIPNYGANWGISYKKIFVERDKFSFAGGSSLEIFDITSGGGSDRINNIFTNNGQFSNQYLIGSVYLPFSYEFNDSFSFNVDSGLNILPQMIKESKFFGSNLYSGIGFKLSDKRNFDFITSIKFPFTGYNTFNSSLNFYRVPIYSYGINYSLDEKVDFNLRITNSFMISPATSLLTIPSDNRPLYYLGLNLKPYNFKQTTNELSSYEERLAFGGLSVSNALLNPSGKYGLTSYYDSKGSYALKFDNSFSDKLSLELFSISKLKNVNYLNSYPKEVYDNFISNDNTNFRLGIKANFIKKQNDKFSYWNSARVSVGRSRNNKQGYYFFEQINSILLSDRITLSINPKSYWTNKNNIYSVGLSSNYKLNNLIDLISEINFVGNKKLDSNYTLGARFFIDQNKSIDFYTSNALGFQDISQMQKSEKNIFGIKFNIVI